MVFPPFYSFSFGERIEINTQNQKECTINPDLVRDHFGCEQKLDLTSIGGERSESYKGSRAHRILTNSSLRTFMVLHF